MSTRRKRQFRALREKRQIVEKMLRSDVSVAVVARRYGANQVFHWRKLYLAGLLGSNSAVEVEPGLRLLPVPIGDDDAKETATSNESSVGVIHIEFPGHALVSLEGL